MAAIFLKNILDRVALVGTVAVFTATAFPADM
jgi:hypothetical protein